MTLSKIENIIQKAFGKIAADKGWTYWREDRVLHFDCQNLPNELRVSGLVQGSQQLPYEVSLQIDPNQPANIQGQCNCAVKFDCKHCAALGYAWLAQRSRPEQPEAETLLAKASPSECSQRRNSNEMPGQKGREKWPNRHQNSQAFQVWLGQLRKQISQNRAERPQSRRLLYVLSIVGEQAQIELRSFDSKRGRNGNRLIRPESLNHLVGPQSRHSPEDQEIGRLLMGLAETGAAGFPNPFVLKGIAGEVVLDLILKSGRCRMQKPDGQRLTPGDSRPLDFVWRQTTKGWQLQATSMPPVKQIFQIDGPWYFDASERSLGILETDLPFGLVKELLKAPVISKGQIESVHAELLKLVPELRLKLPEGARNEIKKIANLEPIPQLLLRGLPREGRDPLYVAQLTFDYDGVLLKPTNHNPSLRLEQKGKSYHLLRHMDAEKRFREDLFATCLETLGDGVTHVLPGDGVLAQAQAWEYWLRVSAPELEDKGWNIKRADDFSLKIYSGESDLEASITNDEKNEWFDLSLGIEVDGEQVNLLPLIEGLLPSVEDPQELLEKLAHEEFLLLPVGVERWLRVPSNRIKGILATLIELYEDKGLNADGSIRLNWRQSLGLGSLLTDSGLVWQGGEHLRKLAGRLQGFGGLDMVAVPEGFKATLRPYQQEGLNWLQFLREFNFHGVLADDMGLGKTIQTLAHLLIEKRSGRADKPSLVIAPTSVVPNWRRESEKFAPDLKVMVLHGANRAENFNQMAEADLILTTYALIRIDLEHYLKQEFHLLILDEAQMIKNPLAKTAQAVCKLNARHRLALSGTPVENHLDELWSIYKFLMPGFLGSAKEFGRRFRTPIEKLGDTIRAEALRQRVRPFLLRRTKFEVVRDLPPKSEMVQYVALNGAQRDLYETVRMALDARVREEIGKIGLQRSQIVLLDALLKLRQICCDPRLPKLEEAKKVKDSAKLEWLLETVPEMVEEGRKILIFSQFVSMLDLIEAGLEKQNISFLRLTGDTRKRESVVTAFQQGEASIFLISLKAGGVGINLTAADTVIHYDPWWNPAAENQATDRAWRIGQDKPVFVYKLICEQTVEEKILLLQQKKAAISEGIYSEQGDGSLRIEAEELLALLES